MEELRTWIGGQISSIHPGGLGTPGRKPLATGHLLSHPSPPPVPEMAARMYGLMGGPYMSGEMATMSLGKALGTTSLNKAHGIRVDKAHGISLDKAHGISLDKAHGGHGMSLDKAALLDGAPITTSMVEGRRLPLPQGHLTLTGFLPGGLAPKTEGWRKEGWKGKASKCLKSCFLKGRA